MKEFILGYVRYKNEGKDININILGFIEQIGVSITIRRNNGKTVMRSIQEMKIDYICGLIYDLEKYPYKTLTCTEIKKVMSDLNMRSYACDVFFQGNLSDQITFDYKDIWKTSYKTDKRIVELKYDIKNHLSFMNKDIRTVVCEYMGNLIIFFQ